MNKEALVRLSMLVGEDAVSRLSEKKVIVFGVGGVGGYVCEALARSGIGTIAVVDNDTVNVSNINRQLIALADTVGMKKTDLWEQRMKSINPDICVKKYDMFYLPENADEIDISEYDFVVDAIDTVSGKIEIVKRAKNAGVPVISSMGTGNKLDPTKITVTDIYKTKVCPLARVMRNLCRKNNIDSLTVVYSEEEPKKALFNPENTERIPPASSAFVPSAAGLTIASRVFAELLKNNS